MGHKENNQNTATTNKLDTAALKEDVREEERRSDWLTFCGCVQVTKSMAGVVKSMDATLKSMNLEKVGHLIPPSMSHF